MKWLSLLLIVLLITSCGGASRPTKTTLDSAKEATVTFLTSLKAAEGHKTTTKQGWDIFMNVVHVQALKRRLSPADTLKLKQYTDSLSTAIVGKQEADTMAGAN